MGHHSLVTLGTEIEAQEEVFQGKNRCTLMQGMQHKASQQHLLGCTESKYQTQHLV
jgi:hypothetical protein